MLENEEDIVVTEEAPVKRKRGRPPKTGGESVTDIPQTEKPATAPKQRKSKNQVFDKSQFARKLQGWHQIAFAVTKLPELQLQDDEAEMLAGDVERLAEEYGVNLGGKMGAWLGLAGSLGLIYAPRALSIYLKIQAAKAAQIPTPHNG